MSKQRQRAIKKVDPNYLYTKAHYARKIKKSHTQVNRMIEAGEVTEVNINGASLVYNPVV